MGIKSLIAIKKRRKNFQPEENPDPNSIDFSRFNDRKQLTDEEKKEQDRQSGAYVKENFVLWKYSGPDGNFEHEGVGVFKFLRKFLDEWTEEQRREYVDNLELIEVASHELCKRAENWIISDVSRFYKKPLCEHMKNPEFLEYKPIACNCSYLVFDILAAKKGKIKTWLTHWNWPFEGSNCEYGYIVDFDKDELHVLFCHPDGEFTSCELLEPLEKIYDRRGLVLSTKFKFSELPQSEKEFVEIVVNNATDPNRDWSECNESTTSHSDDSNDPSNDSDDSKDAENDDSEE